MENLHDLAGIFGSKGSINWIFQEVDANGNAIEVAETPVDWYRGPVLSSLTITREEGDNTVPLRNLNEHPIDSPLTLTVEVVTAQRDFDVKAWNIKYGGKYIRAIFEDNTFADGDGNFPYIFVPLIKITKSANYVDEDTHTLGLKPIINQAEITLDLDTDISMADDVETGFSANLIGSTSDIVVAAGEGIAVFQDNTAYGE